MPRRAIEYSMEIFSEILKIKIPIGQSVSIKNQRGGKFVATGSVEGVLVNCLGDANRLIKWGAFDAVQTLLMQVPGGRAVRGNAMNGLLGDLLLPCNSVEGCIAYYYGYKRGQRVLRRISPVANLLVWAGLCKNAPGELIMISPPSR